MTRSCPLPARPYAAFLFDMDGTILSSIPAVIRAWSAWAARVGVPADDVLHYLHGRRAADTIAHFAPAGCDLLAEENWLNDRELQDMDGVTPIAGAAQLLAALPANRWAIVTSANRPLALRRIAAAGLPLPDLLISSDDVTRGKPDPQGYLMAAQTLGHPIGDCLVFEDTRAGLMAGQAAGADTCHLIGTETPPQGYTGPSIPDYAALTLCVTENGLQLLQDQG